MRAEVFVETDDFRRVVAVTFLLQLGLEFLHFFLLLLSVAIVIRRLDIPSLHSPRQRRSFVVLGIVAEIVVIFEEFFQSDDREKQNMFNLSESVHTFFAQGHWSPS